MPGAAATLRRIARDAQSLPRKVVGDAVKTLSTTLTKRLARDTGGDARLSGAPTRLRVETRIEGETVVTGTVSPNKSGMAQWSWMEYGTGNPGPTRAKHTWTDPASAELETVARNARRQLDGILD